MSDKPFSKLHTLDRQLRKAHPVGMREGVDLTIELICGFELFNTRPYHNYETWSNGWRIKDRHGNVAEAEDLDDAVNKYLSKCGGGSSTDQSERL